jgi:NAD(P)-dependent dehydrogenase (short-subunit alcohol dehydrogenase family)
LASAWSKRCKRANVISSLWMLGLISLTVSFLLLMQNFIAKEQSKVKYMQCDISEGKAVEEMWAQVLRKHGRVDILINNAARSLGKRIRDITFE